MARRDREKVSPASLIWNPSGGGKVPPKPPRFGPRGFSTPKPAASAASRAGYLRRMLKPVGKVLGKTGGIMTPMPPDITVSRQDVIRPKRGGGAGRKY